MTIYLDSTALVSLHVEGSARRIVHEALESETTWATCALTLSESVASLSRLTDEPVLVRYLEDKIRHSWDFFHIVPVDSALLDDAAALCIQQPVGLSTALHLSAAQRLPNPVHYVTFDAAQIPVALSLGFTVVSG